MVTGAGSGIGYETALGLAQEGAYVVVAGRRIAPLEAAVAEIVRRGGQARALVVDLTQRAALRDAVTTLASEVGDIDILINNAGATSEVRNVRWIEDADWDATFEINMNAVFTLVQCVLPSMLKRGGGSIITVSSLAATRPNLLGGAPYGAAKAAVRNFMGYLHNTYRNEGIRATTILPGEVDTPIMDTRVRPPTAEERAAMASAVDIASAVVMCCTLSARSVVEELIIAPTRLRDQGPDIEISRWLGAPPGVGPAKV